MQYLPTAPQLFYSSYLKAYFIYERIKYELIPALISLNKK
jgi:hypothetical protein